jgi:hypothetical protein
LSRLLFAILTIVSGGRVLFGGAAARAAAGDAVPFVLWFNFLSGVAHVLAGLGIAMGRRWAVTLSIALAVAIAAVFVLFGLHVYQGASFEMRSVGAMGLRLLVWVAIGCCGAPAHSSEGSRRGLDRHLASAP